MKTFPCCPLQWYHPCTLQPLHCWRGSNDLKCHLDNCKLLHRMPGNLHFIFLTKFSQSFGEAARRVQWSWESWRDYQVMECPFTLHLLHELFNKLKFTSCFISDFHFYPIHFFCLNGISVMSSTLSYFNLDITHLNFSTVVQLLWNVSSLIAFDSVHCLLLWLYSHSFHYHGKLHKNGAGAPLFTK